MTPGGLQAIGYRGLPDLMAVMRAGRTGRPDVSQADVHDSDLSTAQTISRMVELIRESCADPLMVSVSRSAAANFARLAPASIARSADAAAAWSIWWAVKHMMKFVQDNLALTRMFGPNDALELLISPAAMIRSRQMEGDCDDYTMMVCAMLECCGVPWEICTVAASVEDPSRYSHVYPRAVLSDGSRMVLDASHGKYPGWEVPQERQFRLQVWDGSGDAIPNDARSKWDGLHGYENRRRGIGFAGLGDDDDSGDDSGTDTSILNLPITSPTLPLSTVTYTPPSPGTPNSCESTYQSDCPAGSTWIPATNPFTGGAAVNAAGQYVGANGQPLSGGASALASVLNSAASLFGMATTTTVCNANGVCTTGPANAASTVAAANATGINSSWLMIGGLVIVGLLAVSVMKK
jgi:hypothetical protein